MALVVQGCSGVFLFPPLAVPFWRLFCSFLLRNQYRLIVGRFHDQLVGDTCTGQQADGYILRQLGLSLLNGFLPGPVSAKNPSSSGSKSGANLERKRGPLQSVNIIHGFEMV